MFSYRWFFASNKFAMYSKGKIEKKKIKKLSDSGKVNRVLGRSIYYFFRE